MVACIQRVGLVGTALLAAFLCSCSIPLDEPGHFVARDELSAYYGETVGVTPVPVSNPRFSDNGPAIKAEMLRLIGLAEKHILVGSFLLTDGLESREILDALAARAREGVRVQVIGDASSRFVPEKQAFDYLVKTGVPVAEFNPVRGWRLLALPILLERDHRKFWVIDGRWVSLGGANINDPSLVSPEEGGNRDLMVTVESPMAAGELTRSFVETWNESDAPENLSAADFAPGSPLPNPSSEFWFFNQENIYQKPSQTDVMMDGLFASAKKSIWLVEPYTFVNESILSDIRSMAGRGVEVNVVLSSQARAPRFRYASFYGIKDLSEAGAKVWIFDSETSPLHYKCALVDDALAYVGSSNLNLRSFHLSRELNTVFDDPPSVARVKGVIESVLEDCRLVPLEETGNYRSLPFFAWWAIMQIAG